MISDFLIENENLIRRIFSDVDNVTEYAHIGFGIALVYGAVYLMYVFICKILRRERRLSAWHAVAVFALLIYLTSLLFIVFMSREPGQYDGVNLELWSSWGSTTLKRALFIENIIMFVPMGILLPGAFKLFRNPLICVATCLGLSCFIEHTQFLFGLGIAEIDDVVTNTAGGAIGWLIWAICWMVVLIFRRFSRQREKEIVTKT